MTDLVGAEPTLLDLADWRRRVAVLYADVRRLAEVDVASAHALWRSERERLYRDHPQSPVPEAERVAFRARHFEFDPALRFEVVMELAPPPAPGALALELPNSGGDVVAFRRIGRVTIPFPAGDRTLSVFWMEGYAGGLFLPFRDATNGAETYGAGRYLIDAAKSADLGGDPDRGTVVVDFNFA
ncbi:MAG TPA: DUF1684 domain-containing protein, partial [Candidatus Limnocylindrales bacterium]|nr:DUF1684 domain-containing protein [Candidatus Limnocylindrales bacterium]